jgi:hypothetical protein
VIDVVVDLGLGADADAEELDTAARELLRELGALDGPAPERARVVALGTLVLRVGAEAYGPVARVLQGWLSRCSGRSIKLSLGPDSIEISGGPDAYQQQLIEAFLAARAET